jgi:serine/arginine repetitive matrix protein 2
MAEDDDNFLGGVIEFEDGKQYTIAPAAEDSSPEGSDDHPKMETDIPTTSLTDKDRLADDFDRSWPKSSQVAHQHGQRDLPPHTATAPGGPPPSRNIFNERSNRLEPVPPNLSQRWRTEEHSHPPFTKRGSVRSEHGGPERGLPPHMSQPGPQSIRKRPEDVDSRPVDRPWQSRRDSTNHSAPWNSPTPHDARTRDAPPHGPSGVPFDGMPPPSRPSPPVSHPSRARRPSDATSARDGSQRSGPSASPQLQHAPEPAKVPVAEDPAGPADDVLTFEEASKTAMHNAAERARQRRQQEEDERERQRERARLKAAELERKMSQVAVTPSERADEQPESTDEKKVPVRISPCRSWIDRLLTVTGR